ENLERTAKKKEKDISIQHTKENRRPTCDEAPKDENAEAPNKRDDDAREMVSEPKEVKRLAQDLEEKHHLKQARNRLENVSTDDRAEGSLDEKICPESQEVNHVERVGEAVQGINATIRNRELTRDEVSVAHDCLKPWEETFVTNARTTMPGVNEKSSHRTEAEDEPEKEEKKSITSREQDQEHQGGGLDVNIGNEEEIHDDTPINSEEPARKEDQEFVENNGKRDIETTMTYLVESVPTTHPCMCLWNDCLIPLPHTGKSLDENRP
ncbi:6486_t:CDS:2, partial [Acaulospora morrowiae]